jgi:RNA polymerase sigma-70 factor (ECF subfamily)
MKPWERGRVAWPTVHVAEARFAEHCARLQASDEHAEDLYLACACSDGDAVALAEFEARLVSAVPRFVGRIDATPALADDVKQSVRQYLLVPAPGARPPIAEYSGRGPLAGWVRVVAVRFALQIKRKRTMVSSDVTAAERLAAVEPNPEVALMRARHGADLAAALGQAITGLPDRDRGLIKLSVIDELTIDELCGLYNVHRATVARWIVRLKQQIFEDAMAILRGRLALDTAEVESLCRAVQSQLDFSLGGLLADR